MRAAFAEVETTMQMDQENVSYSLIERDDTEHRSSSYVFTFSPVCKVAAIIIFSAISILSVTGNSAVIYVVLKFKRMRQSPTNLLIMNLAIADLLIGLMNTPTSYWPTIVSDNHHWPFGELLCVVIHFEQIVVVLVSSYTLVAISVDRFVAVMCPMRLSMKLTHERAVAVIAVIWLTSCLISCPVVFVQKLVRYDDALVICHEQPFDWTILGVVSARTYTWCIMVLQYVIPVLVLVVTYVGIGFRLWNTQLPNEMGENQKIVNDRRNSVKKMIPMVMLVSLLYTVCWLPLNALGVCMAVLDLQVKFPHTMLVWWACFTLAMSHSLINPIVYCVRNDNFREGYKYLFQWLPGVVYQPLLLNNERTMTAVHGKYGTVHHMTTLQVHSSSTSTSGNYGKTAVRNVTRSNSHDKIQIQMCPTGGPLRVQYRRDQYRRNKSHEVEQTAFECDT